MCQCWRQVYPKTKLSPLSIISVLFILVDLHMYMSFCEKESHPSYHELVTGYKGSQMEGNRSSLQFPIYYNKCIVRLKEVLSIVALSLWAGLLLAQKSPFNHSRWYLKLVLADISILFCLLKIEIWMFLSSCSAESISRITNGSPALNFLEDSATMNQVSGQGSSWYWFDTVVTVLVLNF